MPPTHLHTTVYVPVVSPPTPAPSPGPTEPSHLLPPSSPSSPTSEFYRQQHAPPTPSTGGPNDTFAVVGGRKEFLSSLLASCTPEELLFISAAIAPRLKRDFLFSLPTELALDVLGFIDEPQTLGRAASVSKRWRMLVREESVWKRMCDVHGFTGDRLGEEQDEDEEQDHTCDDDDNDDSPLEEMEQFANFPTDPALEWLITKRRQELGTCKGKSPQKHFSYRAHFRTCYITMTNWRRGGHLLRSHRIPVVTPESGVVTSLALDADWVLIGLANSRVQVYSARTGVLAKTLVGHESGVWSVSLVSKGGWMAEEQQEGTGAVASPSPPPSANSASSILTSDEFGKRRRRSMDDDGSSRHGGGGGGGSSDNDTRIRASLDNSPLDPDSPSSLPRRRAPRIRNRPHWGTPPVASFQHSGMASLEHLVPASLRVAVGLDLPRSSRGPRGLGSVFGSDEDEPNSKTPPHSSIPFPSPSSKPGSYSGQKRRGQAQRKFSDMCHSSMGWGQPNSIAVSGGCDKVMMVWDVKTGHCIYRLSGHTSTIRCIRVLQNRPIAVSGSRDSTLRVWDIQRGRCLRVLEGHQQSVRCIDVSGNRVVSGSYDATCRVWDVDTGECLHVLQGHFHQIYSVAFDGRYIASGGLDTTVRLWDAETGNCVALLQGHTALVCQLQLSPTQLITGGSDGRVITFSLESLTISHRIAAHDCSVTSLQFVDDAGAGMWWSRGADVVVTGEGEERKKSDVGSLGTSDPASPPPTPLTSLTPTSTTTTTTISATPPMVTPPPAKKISSFLVTGGNDGRVRLYEVDTGNYVRDISEGGESVWRVCVGWGVCVVVCKRAGKTVVEIWSMRPQDEGVEGAYDEMGGEGEGMRRGLEEKGECAVDL